MAEIDLKPELLSMKNDNNSKSSDFVYLSFGDITGFKSISAISGSVLIKDGNDLLNTFPISGHETITLEFRTPGIGSDFIRLKFVVAEVADRVRAPNERGEVYRIRFVSHTVHPNKSTKISKSFKGKISDMAKTIYSDYIGGNLNALPTKNEHRFVIPRWSPFKALEWL